MKIALFANVTKKQSTDLSLDVEAFLKKRGAQVATYDLESSSATDLSDIDFAISLGGDGTILRLVHKYPDLQAPILGINLGHLGFMADVPLSDLYASLEDLLAGSYKVHERIVIEGESSQGSTCFAVNDIVIHRARNPSLVDIAIHVDGLYLNTFEADGIILATPNGSTAYSLAAGGPILSPDLEALVLTPIAPHTISNRPIVLSTTQEIQIQYISAFEAIEVRADGLSCTQLAPGDSFKIRRSKKTFKLVTLPRRNFFSTMRTKLGWAGKLPS